MTVWKFQDYSVVQILREINFGESRSSKTAVYAILGAMNFYDLVKICKPPAPSKSAKIQNSEPLNVSKIQMADFTLLPKTDFT